MPSISISEAYGLALQYQNTGRFADAEVLYRKILAVQPDHANALHRLDEAIAALPRTTELNPISAEAFNDLGVVLSESGRIDEAVSSFRQAIKIKPDCVEACNNLGQTLMDVRRFGEAREALDMALAVRPNYAPAKFNTGLLALLHGDFERGWRLYEARWDSSSGSRLACPQPIWNGEPLDGKRILIYAEQGFGDAIHFVRYVPLIAERGAEVIVVCQPPLVDLFRTAEGVGKVVTDGDPILPPFDVHAPMLSLPMIFQTRRESIPREIPYLFADPAQAECWRKRLGERTSRLRVGVAWSGDPRHRRDRIRSIPLRTLQPLWQLKGIELFSLQLPPEAAQLAEFPTAPIVDHTNQLADFADTAALMSELDLIITVDTAAAHLAGALGRPVWTLLSYVPDWRWGLEGEETPWYPTMRLFRQPAPGEWNAVIERVSAELDAVGHG